MRQKAQNRLWTLIFTMLLCGAALVPGARIARADTAPVDPVPGAPPSDPQAGDPDSPDDGTRSTPAPGGHRGATGQTLRVTTTAHPGSFGMWMLRLRMAFASVYRVLFRD
jgi:hypothetical protein